MHLKESGRAYFQIRSWDKISGIIQNIKWDKSKGMEVGWPLKFGGMCHDLLKLGNATMNCGAMDIE